MKLKRKILLAIIVALIVAPSIRARTVRRISIYLPREVAVDDCQLLLGQIAVLTGDDSMVASAEGILLGKLTSPGQIIKFDRNTVLSRLAANDIRKRYVRFSGAEVVSVKLKAQRVSVDIIYSKAEKLLKNYFDGRDDVLWSIVNKPADFVFEQDVNGVEIKTNFSRYDNNERYKVIVVSLVKDGQILSQQKLRYKLSYKCKQLVSRVNIKKGSVVSAADVEQREVILDLPKADFVINPFGKVARRNIAIGQVLKNNYFSDPKPEKLVRRNHTVMVVLNSAGLLLTVPGKAIEDGYVGDLIKVKVKVTNNERIIVARVLENGNVEPAI